MPWSQDRRRVDKSRNPLWLSSIAQSHQGIAREMVDMTHPTTAPWEAVLFDMYGTLLHQTGGYKATSEYIAGILGIPIERYSDARLKTYGPALTGAFPTSAARAQSTLRLLGIDGNEHLAETIAKAEIDHRKRLLEVFPDSEEVLLALEHRGVPRALVSNATPEWEVLFNSTGLGRYFDATVFSFRARSAKPNPAIYRIALSEIGAMPERCLFVGDGDDDELAGAKRLGMETALIARPGHESPRDSDPKVCDYRIASLTELLDVVAE